MKAKGRNYLRFAGTIEIIIGLVYLGLTCMILSANLKEFEFFGLEVEKSALWTLVLVHATIILKIVAGAFAIVFANHPKMSRFLGFLGGLLLIVQFAGCANSGFDVQSTIFSSVALAISGCYIFGAMLNNKENK